MKKEILLSENGLCMSYRVLDAGFSRLFIQTGGKSVSFFGENEFFIALEQNGKTNIITSRECELSQIKKTSPDSLELRFEHSLFTLLAVYKIKDGVYYKTLSAVAKEPFLLKRITTEAFKTSLPLYRGGEGQPVFAGGEMFIGAEFPAACNGFTADQLDILQNPYVRLEKGGVFSSFDVVFGFRGADTLERSFEKHVKSHALKKSGTLKIYSDWGLHDELSDNIRLSDEMVKDMVSRIKRLKRENGVNFDYYLMDAFWWEDGEEYIGFKKSIWPDGISEVKAALDSAGVKFGLWFDTNMALVRLSPEKSSPRDNCGRFCMADGRTVELLKTALLYHVKNSGMKMIKFDFAYLDCDNKEHSFHAKGGTESKEPAVRNFIEMLSELRAAEPDLKVLCYNGFTTDLSWIGAVVPGKSGYAVSPWWAYYVDYVYCGDPRASEIPSERLEKSVLYYTDAMISQMRKALLPYEFIDDSGTMCANTGTIYYLGKAPLRDSWIMSLSRGGKKLHFYGDLGLLDEKDAAFLKKAERMFDKIIRNGFVTNPILSDAMTEAPYGYSTSNGAEGLITVVNPCDEYRFADIKPNEWADGKDVKIKIWYSDNEIHTSTEYKNVKNTFQAELKPQSVTSFFWTSDIFFDCGQYLKLTLSEGERVSVTVSDKARTVCVSFLNTDNTPIRTVTGIPDSISLEYDRERLNKSSENKPWSGLSWAILKKTDKPGGETVCEIENKGADKITVLWKEKP